MGRNFPVLQRQNDLEEPGYSGGCLEMTEIRLYRPNQQRIRPNA
jgi:hypothetical protein